MLSTCCVKLSAMLHPFFSDCFPCFCELLVAPLSDLQFAPATSKYYTFFVRAIHINVAWKGQPSNVKMTTQKILDMANFRRIDAIHWRSCEFFIQQASGEGAAHTAQFPQNRPGRAGRKRLQVNPFLKANSDARIRYVKNWWARKGLPVRTWHVQTNPVATHPKTMLEHLHFATVLLLACCFSKWTQPLALMTPL